MKSSLRALRGLPARIWFPTLIWLPIVGLYCHSVWATDADSVVIYPAFTASNTVTIEGRIVERKTSGDPKSTDGKRDNLRRSMELMRNDERKDYPLTLIVAGREWQVRTDREGYFSVHIDPLPDATPRRQSIAVRTANGEGVGEILIVPADNTHGLISDIDDTVQVTEVNSKTSMLANTFLRNATQREAVPGIVAFYRQLAGVNSQPDLAPIIYLSASPRQLHTAIESFLRFNEFPLGALITKRVTDDSTSEPITNQVAYKTAKIESILLQLPQVQFTLVGDDGEHDPEIYADIQKRFPNRVAAIWIRKVNPDPKRVRITGQGVLNDELQKYLPH